MTTIQGNNGNNNNGNTLASGAGATASGNGMQVVDVIYVNGRQCNELGPKPTITYAMGTETSAPRPHNYVRQTPWSAYRVGEGTADCSKAVSSKYDITYYAHDALSYSDYDAPIVGKANEHALLELLEGLGCLDLVDTETGAYGSTAVLLRTDLGPWPMELHEALDSLDQYPILDDDMHSELENDEIDRQLEDELEYLEQELVGLGVTFEGDVSEALYETFESLGEYPHLECGNLVMPDIADIARDLKERAA